ncbi:hypothetical protein VST7929_01136 [Vibrio stylophorae]|uniref:Uncharacterized protein n=1 Tax=Vibrio stylophorae TaxID=659351 RepID=A0ABN8DTC0_9VIBR|nr:hypothetical protein [Vibrio stylophorae]CAH0533272.1 hypothetical protein VST7929_01136 [Vibrio stylophorae]
MRNKKSWILSTLLLIVLIGTGLAVSRYFRVVELMEISGTNHAIQQTIESILSETEEKMLAERVNDREISQTMSGMIPYFRYEDFLLETKIVLYTELDSDTMDAAFEWFESPLAKKVRQLEANASYQMAELTPLQLNTQLRELVKDTKRVGLINTYVEKSLLVEHTYPMVEKAIEVHFYAISQSDTYPRDLVIPVEEIESFTKKLEPKIKSRIRTNIMLHSLYSYQDLSDSELEAYIAHISEPNAQKFIALVMESLIDSVIASQRNFVASEYQVVFTENHVTQEDQESDDGLADWLKPSKRSVGKGYL